MAIVMTKRANYEGIADALRSLHNGEETYTPAEMAEYLATQGTELKPENIAEGVTIFGVTGTMKPGNYVDWPPDIPPEPEFDEVVGELDPDAPTMPKMLLMDDKGNVTVGYLYSNFAMHYCNFNTTEFEARDWIRVSYHTTGEYKGQFTVDDFRGNKYSEGWNYYKNIRWSTEEAIYHGALEIWPNPNFYRYGGIVLPPLPDRDETKYPYEFIYGPENNSFGSSFVLHFTQSAWSFDPNTGVCYGTPNSSYISYRIHPHATGTPGWKWFGINDYPNPDRLGSGGAYSGLKEPNSWPRWANYPMINHANNTVFLEASEPVKIT